MKLHPMVQQAEDIHDWLIALRRKIHQYPELSFQEVVTSKLVASELKKIEGMKVETGIKETGIYTGVVGTLANGEGPKIAIRADMDALPIMEMNDHSYRSNNEGIMHACGHDAHTTIGLGVARIIGKLMNSGELTGTVKFIFQPAEEESNAEGLTGSPYMIKAGVLRDVDAILALHMDPERPVGEIKINKGYSMASIDTFQATIIGSGGHAAYPHHGTDPIWMLGTVLQALYSMPTRKISPLEPAVISVTNIHTNSSFNVIPNEVSIKGTIRSYDMAVRKSLEKELEDIFAIVHSLGGEYRLSIQHGEPALNNDKVVTEWIEKTVGDLFPSYKIHQVPYGMGGEDFSYMLQERPGAMFFIGAGVQDGKDRGLHTSIFDIDENVLPNGVAILAETLSRYLNGSYQFE